MIRLGRHLYQPFPNSSQYESSPPLIILSEVFIYLFYEPWIKNIMPWINADYVPTIYLDIIYVLRSVKLCSRCANLPVGKLNNVWVCINATSYWHVLNTTIIHVDVHDESTHVLGANVPRAIPYPNESLAIGLLEAGEVSVIYIAGSDIN